MRLVVVGRWNEWCESLRHAPDEIDMLLELLDTRFDVNPWATKTAFYLTMELVYCSEKWPYLPRIIFQFTLADSQLTLPLRLTFPFLPRHRPTWVGIILITAIGLSVLWIYWFKYCENVNDNKQIVQVDAESMHWKTLKLTLAMGSVAFFLPVMYSFNAIHSSMGFQAFRIFSDNLTEVRATNGFDIFLKCILALLYVTYVW